MSVYHYQDSIAKVSGIGPVLAKKLQNLGIFTVKDFILHIPLRYEDRSQITTIAEALKKIDELVTIKARVVNASSFRKNGRIITSANIEDETARLKCIWFNNKFIKSQLKIDQEFYFSGKVSSYHNLAQATVEAVKEKTLHTGRIVPIYSGTLNIKQGIMRRILDGILDNLDQDETDLANISSLKKFNLPDFKQVFKTLHFPDQVANVQKARHRLALEEFLTLMKKSAKIKKHWQNEFSTDVITSFPDKEFKLHNLDKYLPPLPFALTTAQKKATFDCLKDLARTIPMNRLLVGDVGSGKTAVAALSSFFCLKNNYHVCFVAPTQILAQQHYETLQKLLPEQNIILLTSKESKKFKSSTTATLYIGTHALINKFQIINPRLVIYDEQHRFGVKQRSEIQHLAKHPHVLTMTATPIPRTLMLTIFSHLELSVLDEMPPGRIPPKTWLVKEEKRQAALNWIAEEIRKTKENGQNLQVLFVYPFIDPSASEALENVKAATNEYEKLHTFFNHYCQKNQLKKKITITLLHSRINKKEKDQISQDLFKKKIDVLVTTPVIEVGLDLPSANIIVIEAAERFGLASLHQLRGRVGRAGQKSSCLLFVSSQKNYEKKRLQVFTKETNGSKLAEYDLENRGAGDIFGISQHGFMDLQFSSWSDSQTIATAQQIYKIIEDKKINWQPFFPLSEKDDIKILAN